MIINTVKRFSVFQKMISAFIFVILISGVSSWAVSKSTMSNIITKQIFDGKLNTMELTANGINDLVKRATSVVVGLSIDQTLHKCLIKADNMKNASQIDILSNINDINSILQNYTYSILTTDCNTTIILNNGDVFGNWETQDKQNVEVFKLRYDKYFSVYRENFDKANIISKGIEKNPVLESSKSNEYVLTLIFPIKDNANKKLLGIIVLNLPEERLQKEVTSDNTLKTIIIDQNSSIISANDKKLIGKSLEGVYGVSDINDSKGYIYTGEKKELIMSYLSIKELGWKIIDIMNSHYIDKEVNRVTVKLVFITLFSTIALLILSYIISMSITLPLKKLMKQMLDKDYNSVQLSYDKYGKNEIAMLEESFYIMKNNINALMKENKQKEKEKRETEIKALQSQIRPHFLFNTLNAIRWSALNNNSKKAADIVLALSNLLRMTLVKGEEMISLKEEIESIKYYVEIVRMRHSTQFEVIYDIEESLNDFKIPKLLLQPLVENSIVHGFADMKTGGVISIIGMIIDEYAIIQIIDNGTGLGTDSSSTAKMDGSKFSGIGVNNVDKRIKLYFGEEYGINLYTSQDRNTVAEIRLPIIMEQEGDLE